MGIAYWGIKNNSNYTITTDGKLLEIGRNRRINAFVPSAISYSQTQTWPKINLGYFHSLAIQSNGTLWISGNNSSGQLGLSDLTNRSSFIQVGNLSNWAQISAGQYYSLAIQSNGTLWGWGYNNFGQLGNNTVTNFSSPVQVGSLSTWTQIACGYYHSLALQSNNTLWTWGSNTYGQLGYDSTSYRLSAILVGSPTNITWAKLPVGTQGDAWSLAIDTNNTLYGFGDNTGWLQNYLAASPNFYSVLNTQAAYSLDDGQFITAPTTISSNVAQVSVGRQAAAFIKTDGSLWSWGNNTQGQLGLSWTTSSLGINPSYGPEFSPFLSNSNWKIFGTPNALQNFAIQSNGTLWGWGFNQYGQIGNNTNTTPQSSPTQVGFFSTWSQVTPGKYQTLGILSNGTLWAWGNNSYGQLGLNDLASTNGPGGYSKPIQILPFSTSQINPYNYGNDVNIIIQSNGTLWGWGNGSNNQLGLNDNVIRSSPIQIGSLSTWTQIANGYFDTLAIQSNGTLWSWGYNSFGLLGLSDTTNRSTPTQVGTLSVWTQVSSGTYPILAIQSNGTLWSWGANDLGQLGQSDTTDRYSPIQVGALSTWKQVACGYKHVLALQSDGTLWSWGANGNGQLGQSNTTNRYSPVQVGTSLWKQIFGGFKHSLAIQSNGTLWACGYNFYGQLGTSDLTDRTVFTQIGVATNWAQIAAGYIHSLAIQSNGTLWAWGNNSFGQLGTSDVTHRSTPIQVGILTGWTKVSALKQSSLALLSGSAGATANLSAGGTLWTWGNGGNGQLGMLYDTSNRLIPVLQPSVPASVPLTNWGQISSGLSHNLAINFSSGNSYGTLWSWGYNVFGQLGLSNTTNRSIPTQVGLFTNWTQVFSGALSCFAIQNNGSLWSWGYNNFGQLGTSDVATKYTPVQVGSLNIWKQVACGYYHALAIQSNSTLWAWGGNSYGQLGTSDITHRSSPIQVGSLSTWTQIACGYYHSAAIQSNGTLWAWGANTYGQLALSDLTLRYSPVQVGNLSTWTRVVGFTNGLIANLSNGTYYAFGSNSFRQLAKDTNFVYSPTQIGTASNWTKVSHGSWFVMAQNNKGELWGWGYNVFGQLGRNNTIAVSSPIQALSGTGTQVVQFACGYSHVAIVKYDGSLWAWGNNSYGQLGQGDYTHRSTPVQVGTISQYTNVFALNYTTLANLL